MHQVEKAIILAAFAHMGQTDKAGRPYILHPLRIMAKMRTDAEQVTAVLHDVVEDTTCTLDDLRERAFPDDVTQAIDCLTRRDGESYDAFIRRLAPNPLARRVKLADLEDNMDIRRLNYLTTRDVDRLDEYMDAWKYLTNAERAATIPQNAAGQSPAPAPVT